ncbi:uncharacterized protein LOC133886709 isoform X2 [Phragmites australis]|uniref:uncharacterized protein LOC133886709 isoform X2 n=1 Tax=Phragmites australis TaxID=29695 RepID=UPI002D799C47|nr:uncharacterized protein LOC133886709 isoform X2 [Phragmites australis]
MPPRRPPRRRRCSPPRLPAVSSSLRRSSGSFAARGEAAVTASDSASASAGLLAVGAWQRAMLTTKGRSMRSKVEKQMARETGRTQRELRRAVKLRKKLMTEDEKLIYSLRRVRGGRRAHRRWLGSSSRPAPKAEHGSAPQDCPAM